MRTLLKSCFGIAASLGIAIAATDAKAVIVTEYKFENTLADTGVGGVADTLSGLNTSGGAQVPVFVPGAPGLGQAVVISRTAGNAASLFAPDSADLDLSGAFTIESFAKPDATGVGVGTFQRLLLKWGVGNSYHFGIQGADSNDVNLFLNGVAAGTGGTVVGGQWQHLAAVGDGVGTVRLYRDGTQVASAAYSGSLNNGTDPLTIGQRAADVGSAAHQYSGQVDEVRLHNSAESVAYLQSRAKLLSPNAANPTTGLVNFYKFEGNAEDSAPMFSQNVGTSTTNLTTSGAVSFVPGMVGQAADLNGGFFSTPHVADIELSPSFTIEAWINPDAVTPGNTNAFQRLVLNWGAQTSYHFGIRGDDVNLFVNDAGGNREVATGGDIVAGQWQHIAATVDGPGGLARVFLNGVQVGTSLLINGSVLNTTTEGLGIGDSASSFGFRYSGLIDELAMWRTALSADQIRTHYLSFNNAFIVPVPEPTTATLAGLAAMGLMRRRRAIR